MLWSPRNTVNVVIAGTCAVALVLLETPLFHGAWITAVSALLFGALLGLVTPGSPIGRYLDTLIPTTTTVTEKSTVVVTKTVDPPPADPPRGNPGFVLRETLAWPALIGLAIGCVAMLLALSHAGCASRQYTPPENTLLAIHSTAHGVALTDALVAPHCGVASPAPACSSFVVAYALARTNLILAESLAVDWRAHPSATAACRVVALLRAAVDQTADVQGALETLHVPQPAELVSGLGLIGVIVAGQTSCPATDGGV